MKLYLRALFRINSLQYRIKLVALSLVMLSITGCGGHVYHVVERGETLYSIGWAYGYDYRQVAQWNGIASPYYLSPGQRLRVAPPFGHSTVPLQEYRPTEVASNATRQAGRRKAAPVVEAIGVKQDIKEHVAVDDKPGNASSNVSGSANSAKNRVNAVVSAAKKMFSQQTISWRWPTKKRRVLRTYSSKDPTRQGLDIAGEKGSPVYAAAAGRVVYAGSGLARYGRLIIVKHSEKYLSAYAHNYKLHVKEGEVVKAGQRIADMGGAGAYSGKIRNDSKRAKLHFEIRRNGKPVDPMQFLPR